MVSLPASRQVILYLSSFGAPKDDDRGYSILLIDQYEFIVLLWIRAAIPISDHSDGGSRDDEQSQ